MTVPMADATTPAAGSPLNIPADIAAKFPELLDLIKGSESMNDEERQYWINILPIMTPDQVQNLHEILDNERKQLKAIDEKYAQQMNALGSEKSIKESETERREKREARTKAEQSHKTEEEKAADDLLRSIEQAS